MTKRDGLFFEMDWALWEIVRVFKAVTSYEIRRAEGQPWFAWQEEYYDSVIRTEAALQEIVGIFSRIRCGGARTSCIGGIDRRGGDGADKSAEFILGVKSR